MCLKNFHIFLQFSSVTQLCPTLCDPVDCRMPGFPVHHHLPELAQTRAHWVSDISQPSHPLLPPSSLALNLILCCPLLLLPSILPSIRVFSNASTLRIRWPKYWSFRFSIMLPMNIQDWFPIGWTGLISLQSKGLSTVFSNITVEKLQFFGSQPSLWSNFHIRTWLLEKTIPLTIPTFVGNVSVF